MVGQQSTFVGDVVCDLSFLANNARKMCNPSMVHGCEGPTRVRILRSWKLTDPHVLMFQDTLIQNWGIESKVGIYT